MITLFKSFTAEADYSVTAMEQLMMMMMVIMDGNVDGNDDDNDDATYKDIRADNSTTIARIKVEHVETAGGTEQGELVA